MHTGEMKCLLGSGRRSSLVAASCKLVTLAVLMYSPALAADAPGRFLLQAPQPSQATNGTKATPIPIPEETPPAQPPGNCVGDAFGCESIISAGACLAQKGCKSIAPQGIEGGSYRCSQSDLSIRNLVINCTDTWNYMYCIKVPGCRWQMANGTAFWAPQPPRRASKKMQIVWATLASVVTFGVLVAMGVYCVMARRRSIAKKAKLAMHPELGENSVEKARKVFENASGKVFI